MFEQRCVASADCERAVLDGVPADSLAELFSSVARWLATDGELDADAIVAALHEREAQGSTAIAPGVVMPHCVMPGRGISHVVFARPEHPVEDTRYGGVRLIVLLLVRADASEPTRAIIRRTSRSLADDELLEALASAPSGVALQALIPTL